VVMPHPVEEPGQNALVLAAIAITATRTTARAGGTGRAAAAACTRRRRRGNHGGRRGCRHGVGACEPGRRDDQKCSVHSIFLPEWTTMSWPRPQRPGSLHWRRRQAVTSQMPRLTRTCPNTAGRDVRVCTLFRLPGRVVFSQFAPGHEAPVNRCLRFLFTSLPRHPAPCLPLSAVLSSLLDCNSEPRRRGRAAGPHPRGPHAHLPLLPLRPAPERA
jgi:hypothetical protein